METADKIRKLEQGVQTITVESEKNTLETILENELKKLEPKPKKYTQADIQYWVDIRKFSVGIFRPVSKSKLMYRKNEVYDRYGDEKLSLQEMVENQILSPVYEKLFILYQLRAHITV